MGPTNDGSKVKINAPGLSADENRRDYYESKDALLQELSTGDVEQISGDYGKNLSSDIVNSASVLRRLRVVRIRQSNVSTAQRTHKIKEAVIIAGANGEYRASNSSQMRGSGALRVKDEANDDQSFDNDDDKSRDDIHASAQKAAYFLKSSADANENVKQIVKFDKFNQVCTISCGEIIVDDAKRNLENFSGGRYEPMNDS